MAFPFHRLVFGSIFTLLAMYYKQYEDLDREQAFPTGATIDEVLPRSNEYDFIIVGGGTAGSVVANKLSAQYHVLILEIGGDPLPPTFVPGYFTYNYVSYEAAHNWTSVKQKHASLGIDNGHVTMQQGKALGGTTTINGLSYNRGHPLDWDNWGNYTGDKSWCYDNMVKYFKMSENFYQEEYNDHLGFGGPMQLSKNEDTFNDKEMAWFQAWNEAGRELGYHVYENSNAPQVEGFGTLTQIKREGRRYSAYEAFLKPIFHRHTLTIHRYSEVKKIDIDEKGRAVGVFYLRHGIESYATARKEIIVSAGTMNSPLILMRSGIGPKDQLEEAGIPVRANLPVAKYYHDHPGLWLAILKIPQENDPYDGADESTLEYFIKEGKGPMANWLGVFGQAFLVSSVVKEETPDLPWPDIQFIACFNSSVIFGGDNSLIIFVSIGRPKSWGTFRLDTTDPHNKPLIWDPNYMSDQRDVRVIIEGMNIAVKIFETEAFKKLGGSFERTPIPECKSKQFGTDDYWECLARQKTKHIWHPVGSCRMGAENDPEATVDTQLRVKGIKGLRVADNSIQPSIVDANTMAPALVIGQRAAEFILNAHKKK